MTYKALVVDDTNFMRKMAADCLKQHGYTVAGEACNGKEAIAKYAELKPDFVLMDLTMPEMNGIDAIREILKLDSKAVILVCTASNQQDLIFDAIELGAKGYLTKPFNSGRMNDIIRKHAEPHILSRANQESAETNSEVSSADQKAEGAENIQDVEANAGADDNKNNEVVQTQAVENNQGVKVVHEAHVQDQVAAAVEAIAGVNGSSYVNLFNPTNPLTGKMPGISFTTSYMCNWQEDIEGEKANYSVICTQNENKIVVEMSDHKNEKQVIRFSLEGFQQLVLWLQNHNQRIS